MSDDLRIGIIGSGFGALAVAIEVTRAGHHDVRLWERADSLGGVWRDNNYPGAGCDVPSPLYSFSYEQSTRWNRRYGLQGQILEYLDDTAAKYGITPRIRFNHEVTSATWDEESRTWTVGFAHGGTETVDVLVSAIGQLSNPVLPKVPGIETFAGPSFHSAQWDHSVDLKGKKVAVVGTGASAIQFVPPVADDAGEVTLFQRSANWILPKLDGSFARWYKPFLRLERPVFWSIAEQFSRGLDDTSRVGHWTHKWAQHHLTKHVPDPELRAKLTPDYPMGCKRILFSNNYYPTLMRDHVDVVTERIAEVTPTGVVAADGSTYEADVIIYGTGFDAQDFLSSIDVTGRHGTKLAEQWSDGAHAYLGIYAPNFPNLLISYGPNTNLGGGSIVYMLEAQARHMRQVLDRMRSGGFRTVEVTEAAEAAYDREVQGELEHSAWAHCDSWYRHASGRITSNWPASTHPYAKRTRTLEPEAFTWQ
ncbi:MAG TPA: NAD(P)/FAD-dependent oxidoreductase [Aeromicrobium sp.]|nr:NAD(P)/FAD-dependent oxidoreductase [Aeromicrobium sp.]